MALVRTLLEMFGVMIAAYLVLKNSGGFAQDVNAIAGFVVNAARALQGR